MIPDLSSVGAVAAAVRDGVITRAHAVEVLTAAGFVDADGILRDLLGGAA